MLAESLTDLLMGRSQDIIDRNRGNFIDAPSSAELTVCTYSSLLAGCIDAYARFSPPLALAIPGGAEIHLVLRKVVVDVSLDLRC